MSDDPDTKPKKRATTLKAGGGQSSALSDHQTVKELSPPITKRLEKIYDTTINSGVKELRDGPLLTSFDDFKSWFKSPASAALAPPPDHDMTLPLCNYFISSSHNTYLSGNQLYGTATTSSYTDVLLRGCRCMEIDVWNGDDEVSSVSSSDVEDAEKDRSTTQKKSRSTVSRFKSMRTKAKEKLRRGSKDPPQDEGYDEHEVDDLTRGLSATQIAERRARLKTEPKVYHGHTLTKDIPFREVCEAIGLAAFKASTLPIIVSLEVHCNLDQQQVMVKIMRDTWAGHLVDMSGTSYEDIHELPSPDSLRNKILIKVKWTPSDSGINNPNELVNAKSNDSGQTDGASSSKQKKKAAKILDELSKLGVYTRAYSFKSFAQPEAKIPTHIFSLDENKLGDIHSHARDGPSMFQHNRDFLVRIYPSGLRVNSSNIDPAFSWRQGAQIVALNWQSLDQGMMLNEGMFAGEEGWVLKPHGFRSSTVSEQTHPVRRKLNLTIRLIAAQNLPCQPDKDPSHIHDLKPYVKFQLHVDTHGPPGRGRSGSDASTADLTSKYGHEHGNKSTSAGEERDEDERKLKRKSKSVKTVSYKNINTNDFEDTEMIWTDVPDVVEELSFLRIKIEDDRTLSRDDLVAWACIRLDRLKTGYRFIHLLDVEGAPSEGVLFVKIDKAVH